MVWNCVWTASGGAKVASCAMDYLQVVFSTKCLSYLPNGEGQREVVESHHVNLLPKLHQCFSMTFRLKFQLLNDAQSLPWSGPCLPIQLLLKPPPRCASQLRSLAVSEQNLLPPCISVLLYFFIAPTSRVDSYGKSSKFLKSRMAHPLYL